MLHSMTLVVTPKISSQQRKPCRLGQAPDSQLLKSSWVFLLTATVTPLSPLNSNLLNSLDQIQELALRTKRSLPPFHLVEWHPVGMTKVWPMHVEIRWVTVVIGSLRSWSRHKNWAKTLVRVWMDIKDTMMLALELYAGSLACSSPSYITLKKWRLILSNLIAFHLPLWNSELDRLWRSSLIRQKGQVCQGSRTGRGECIRYNRRHKG